MSAPRCLRLLFGGRQGAGKTCLASALAGQPLVWSPGRGPKPAQASWKRAGMAFTALELPGFGVEGQGEPRRQELQAGALAGADLLVLAAPAPEEAWGLEAGWLAGALAAAPGFPVLVCATRIDLLGSPRDWEPEALERELACGRPASPKAKAVAAWARRLEDALAVAVPSFRPERFCLTAAGDGTPAFGASFGMDRLRRLVCQSLPEAVQHRARLALALDSEELRPKAEKIIWTASVSAAAASLAPVPAVDAAMVATVQAGMIVAIAGLYGCVLSRKTALAMLAPAAGALGLRVALASALKGVISQRLVRRICPDCKTAYKPTEDELRDFDLPEDSDETWYRGKGCPTCYDRGYRGRVAVFEMLPINHKVRDLIYAQAGRVAIEAELKRPENGFVSMQQNALRLVREGITTAEEVRRVIHEED